VTPDDFSRLTAEGTAIRSIQNGAVAFSDPYWTGGGYTLLPLSSISRSYKIGRQVDLMDEHMRDIGCVLPLSGHSCEDVSLLSDLEYIAYLAEVAPEAYGHPHSFLRSYAAIRTGHLNDYLSDRLAGAPVWGAFVHDIGSVAGFISDPAVSDGSPVQAFAGIDYPTWHHVQSALRSVAEPFSFERFLKVYHLLELVADWDVVQGIRALGHDLAGIGQLLSAYSGKDRESFYRVMQSRCRDPARIASLLAEIRRFPVQAISIFYDYSKDGNPLKEQDLFNQMFIVTNFSSAVHSATKDAPDKKDFHGFCLKLASYWIYRIRCCIAHNRIGEYVMTPEDEPFMVGFAEPLIREIASQAFKLR